MEATGDTWAFTRFYDLVCDHAHRPAELGDPDPLGARKAKALGGGIADAQSQLELFGEPATDLGDFEPVDRNQEGRIRRPSLARTRLYLHLSVTDLLQLNDPSDQGDPLVPVGTAVGQVERLGPATVTRIKEWLGASRATIVPVLDPSRDEAVDRHDPPAWMWEQVVLRDRHCVFPWCRIDARSCDLDHIDPYVPPDDGGPPGQTSPSRLACLCRRHHNAKTGGRWRYLRNKDGTYTWRGPYGQTYLVTPLGTTTLPNA